MALTVLLQIIKHFFTYSVRMNEKSIIFDDKNIKKVAFIEKKLFKIDDIDGNKILVSKKEPYGKKNLI